MSIGYACHTMGVPKTELRRCILKNATDENLRRLTLSNLNALEAMIDYNIYKKIKLFRISSDIIPFASHPVNQLEWWKENEEILRKLGQKLIQARIRVSMHPGQYTVLNSPDYRVVQNAIKDLEYHERFLSSLGMDNSCKLILHIGGVYGNKKNAIETFLNNYQKLPQNIKNRLVIENDDRNFNIEEILSISNVCGAPVVFDNLHHLINPPVSFLTDAEWILLCKAAWSKDDGIQKIHYSQQKAEGRPGSHSDTINLDEFIEYYKQLPDQELDIMLEVKDKNISAVRCMEALELDKWSR